MGLHPQESTEIKQGRNREQGKVRWGKGRTVKYERPEKEAQKV